MYFAVLAELCGVHVVLHDASCWMLGLEVRAQRVHHASIRGVLGAQLKNDLTPGMIARDDHPHINPKPITLLRFLFRLVATHASLVYRSLFFGLASALLPAVSTQC